MLAQVTVVPALTVSELGWKEKLDKVTEAVRVLVVVVVRVVVVVFEVHPTRLMAIITITNVNKYLPKCFIISPPSLYSSHHYYDR